MTKMTAEQIRLEESRERSSHWKRWGPYVSERAWGTVREDLKEYYFYQDSTPTHSYMKFLYKYPQAEFPYQQLLDENRRRSKNDPEFELLDTGIFDENRYFDVQVEYAKASTEDILIKISVTNHGPQSASLRLLPTIWFRNTWAWHGNKPRPQLSKGAEHGKTVV